MTPEGRSQAGRVLFVTGGGRGIGAATVRRAAANGWRVGFTYRADADAASDLAAEVAAAGGQALAIRSDAAERGAAAAAMAQAEAAYGSLDAVVVNAGVIGPRGALATFEDARIARLVDVNVTAALWTAAEAARRLGAPGRVGDRSVVFVSSAAARLGSGGEFVDYAATKGALDTATRGLAMELGPLGVRVNAVRPGLIETDIHVDAGWAGRAEALGAHTPLGRPGRAEEVAAAILWLVSSEASYVSGALLDVSGGR